MKVSNRLVPRPGPQPYVIIRKVGANSFYLGDVATETLVSGFAQPVSADNLVAIEIPELGEALETKVRLSIDGEAGEVTRQAADGRVLVKFDNLREAWKDLSQEEFLWH